MIAKKNEDVKKEKYEKIESVLDRHFKNENVKNELTTLIYSYISFVDVTKYQEEQKQIDKEIEEEDKKGIEKMNEEFKKKFPNDKGITTIKM